MELSLNPLALAYLYIFSVFRQTRLVCLNLFNAIFSFFFSFPYPSSMGTPLVD